MVRLKQNTTDINIRISPKEIEKQSPLFSGFFVGGGMTSTCKNSQQQRIRFYLSNFTCNYYSLVDEVSDRVDDFVLASSLVIPFFWGDMVRMMFAIARSVSFSLAFSFKVKFW